MPGAQRTLGNHKGHQEYIVFFVLYIVFFVLLILKVKGLEIELCNQHLRHFQQ